MAIVLISWVAISVVLCLAFLGAAACPAPSIDEEILSGTKTCVPREAVVASRNAKLASQSPESAVPSSYQAA